MGRRVDIDDLVDSVEVARLIGLTSRKTLSIYLARYPDMPRPVFTSSGGRCMIWLRTEVSAWARRTGRQPRA